MDNYSLHKITDALLQLQRAFEEADLAAPAIVLGSPEDARKLASFIRPQDLIYEIPRESAAALARAADVPKTSPIQRRLRATLAGTKLYEPHEIKHA